MRHDELKKFCRDNDVRPYVREPFRLADGRVAATNGWAIIIASEYDGDKDALMAAPANVESTMASKALAWSDVAQWIDVSSLDMTLLKCDTCKGTGRARRMVCESCDGEGFFEHHGHDYDCKNCENGYIYGQGDEETCDDCSGTGHNQSPMKIAGMGDKYGADARLIAMLPAGAKISPCEGDMLQVSGDGYTGFIMGYRLDKGY